MIKSPCFFYGHLKFEDFVPLPNENTNRRHRDRKIRVIMGALISLPINFAGSFIASGLGACFSNLCSQSLSAISSSSLGTRLLYALWLLMNSLISWIYMSTNRAILWPSQSCTATHECGWFTVHRLNFSLGSLHLLLAVSLVGVKSTKNGRAVLQNSWWFLKFLCYIFLIVLSFMIPNGFFVYFSKWVSVPAGAIFIIVGLILLVDFAHEWAETCIQHVENQDNNSSFWKKSLIIGTALMYTVSLAMIIEMYIVFCHNNCSLNQFSATINIFLTLTTAILSIHPRIQEANPNCGLAQSSMVSLYCSYLVLSAMASEPDDKMCNPLVRSNGTRNFSVVMGSILTFIAIAYTTTRAAANSAFQGTNTNGAIYLDDGLEQENQGTQSRNQLRYEAIRQAVEEGSLPESALFDTNWLAPSVPSGDSLNDERNGTKYNYSLFHLIFFIATQWIAILLTIEVTQDDVGDFIPVGRTYFYSWVKICSAYLCYALYGWTVIAPLVMPERFEVYSSY